MVSRVLAGRRPVTLLVGVVLMSMSATNAFAQDEAAPNPFAATPSADVSTAPATAGPTIVSDKDDYPPGAHVVLTGAGWQPGESVQIYVQDDQGQTWSERGTAVAGEDGTLTYELNLPNHFVAVYSVEATGETSGVARTTFTDGNVKVENAASVPVGVKLTYTLNLYANRTTCTGTFTTEIREPIGPGSGSTIGGVNTTDRYTLSVTSAAGAAILTPAASGCIAGPNGSADYFGSVPAKQNQTITFVAPVGKTYGEADFGLGATASPSNLAVSYASSTPSVCTIASGLLHIVAAGSCTVTASQAGNATYNAATPVPRTFAIGKKALTVTASDASVTYGDDVPSITASYEGFVNGDTPLVVTGTTCSTEYTDGSGVVGSPYGTSCEGAMADNYSFSYVAGEVEVTPASLTVTASSPTVTYGAAEPTITRSYGGFVNDEGASDLTTVPTCSTTYTDGSGVAGSPYASSCSGGVSDNYSFTYVDGGVTVDRAVVAVTASGASLTYGAAAPTITASYDGFVNDEDEDVLTTDPTCSTTYVQGAGVLGSPYASSCERAEADNYTFTYTDGEITVAAKSVTVTASDESVTYGDGAPTITASYDGFIDGEDETVLIEEPICTTEYTAGSGVGGSPYDSSCTGASAANYTFTYASGEVTVAKAPLTANISTETITYGDPVPTFTATYTGWIYGPEDVDGDLACDSTDGHDAGTHTVSCSGLSADNYAISYAGGSLVINKATLYVDADDASMTYAGAAPSLTATLSGFKGTDTAETSDISGGESCSIPGGTDRDAGTYAGAIECGPGTLVAPNYEFVAGAKGSLTIEKADQTITFGPIANKVLGSSDFDPGATASSGLTVAYSVGSSTACSIVADKVRILAIGTCTVTASQPGNGNYNSATAVSRTFNVIFRWDGFLQPINDTAHQIGVHESKFKSGQTIPVKFVLKNASGAAVQAATLPTFASKRMLTGCDNVTDVEAAVPVDAISTGTTFKWDGSQYHYNYSTKGLTVGEYRIYASLADGTVRTVDICLTK